MANQEHLDILKQGVEVWNKWREEHPKIRPDLREVDLQGADLNGANLSGGDLSDAIFSNANLQGADLLGADLFGADFFFANLSGADLVLSDLRGACFIGANLHRACLDNTNLNGADLNGANLREADLSNASLVRANLEDADLTGCKVYGIAAWDIRLKGARQGNLVITDGYQPTITVDNLEVAQFIYLLLNNKKIRNVIDSITSKVVLILGRFTPERKRVLNALKEELRKKDFLPIVFDFDVPTNRNVTETVTTLARLSRFIIADLTDPKCIPQEMAFIVPDLPSVPVQPLLHARSKEYGMYDHFKSFPWVLEAHRYTTVDRLLATLREHVIEPAEKRAKELAIEKAERLKRP